MVGGLILERGFVGVYFKAYPFIPIYFYAIGLFSIYIFDVCRYRAPQKMLMIYLAIKSGKMILSVFVAVVLCMFMQEHVKAFLLTFISFYLLYLIFETCFFAHFEMNLKQKKNKVENETIAS